MLPILYCIRLGVYKNTIAHNLWSIIYLVLLGYVADSAFAYWYRIFVSLYVCQDTFVHCAQTAEDIDTIFLHRPARYDSVLRFGLIWQNASTSFPLLV